MTDSYSSRTADPSFLPSFPTRRSSDLIELHVVVNVIGLLLPRDRVERRLRDINKTLLRSEEHTSELQSLRHLVCRLLLEKKNKKRYKLIKNERSNLKAV